MKNSKTAENGTPHGRATGVHGRAPRAEEPKLAQLAHGQPCQAARPAVRHTHGRACVHARPCVCARTAVRGGTAGRAVRHGRAVSRRVQFAFFRCFYSGFGFIFGGPLLNLFESVFRIELGLGLG